MEPYIKTLDQCVLPCLGRILRTREPKTAAHAAGVGKAPPALSKWGSDWNGAPLGLYKRRTFGNNSGRHTLTNKTFRQVSPGGRFCWFKERVSTVSLPGSTVTYDTKSRRENTRERRIELSEVPFISYSPKQTFPRKWVGGYSRPNSMDSIETHFRILRCSQFFRRISRGGLSRNSCKI